ncbi:MAG: hypothetical protein AAGE94_06290 [Acidobacteriota bacterium]
MHRTLPRIRAVLPDAPEELGELYDSMTLPQYPESRIQCLGFPRALESTMALAEWLIPDELGLWVLDDANDSNPFCYITKGPCRGAILHFRHDDAATVAFPSLESWLTALHAAGRDEIDIDEMPRPEAPTFECAALIRQRLPDDTEENETLVCLYLSCSGPLPDDLVAALARHESFYIRESLAEWLVRHPAEQHLGLAEALAADGYRQVAVHGVAARKAINRLIHS